MKVERPWRAVFLGGELNGRVADVGAPFDEQTADLAEVLGDARLHGVQSTYRRSGNACAACHVVVYRHVKTAKALVIAQPMDVPAFRRAAISG